jgi:predicted small secreted protein
MRKLVILALAATGLLAAACNTIEGAGQDVEAAGAAIEETAQDAK